MSYYKMERGWQDHEIFGNDEYSRRDAWIWLISKACWKDTRWDVNGKIVTLKRGQLSYSIRYMAEKWKWHRCKVERFLERLKTETMIETASETGQLIINICNYDRFQVKENETETMIETASETETRQNKEEKEIIKNTLNAPARTHEETSEDSSSAWIKVGAKINQILEESGMMPLETRIWVSAWLQAEADPDTDIYPIVRKLCAAQKAKSKTISTLKYCNNAVMEAVSIRKNSIPEVFNEKIVRHPRNTGIAYSGGNGRAAVYAANKSAEPLGKYDYMGAARRYIAERCSKN